jgi:hypothetical protein
MKWVPFTAHIKITPKNPGKRFEYWRDMQKIAGLVYEGLETLTSTPATLSIASPGGGQQSSKGGTEANGLSGYMNGCAVVPQMGATPTLLQITGFYSSNLKNIQAQNEITRISGGEVRLGATAAPWVYNAKSTIDAEVVALRSAMEAAIDTALPSGVGYKLHRLHYSGVTYGDRGCHFPV